MSSTLLSSGLSSGQPHPARPHGPRIPRSASPPVYSAPTAPLKIRKSSTSASKPEISSLLAPQTPPLSRTPTPKLALQIPTPPTAGKGKPSLKLAISGASSSRQTPEPTVALYGGDYYGGPQTPSVSPPINDCGVDDATIRPSTNTSRPLSMDDVRRTINDIEVQTRSTPPPPTYPGEEQIDDQQRQIDWSDDIFDEVTRLGEGAGGAVHEVRDKRTGKFMARKTITTREAPMKQVVRELEIITSIKHPNIIHFYGAYMSPSSSEVKVVMEICQGKSLEAVSKRIKERGARVGEKVAGRLAEGVYAFTLLHYHGHPHLPLDITGSRIPSFKEADSPRY